MEEGLLMSEIQYGQVTSGAVIYERITEASDTRITEAGDIRITNDVFLNNVESILTADPTLIVSIREMYYNVAGVWKFCTPYLKHSGTWKEPSSVYIKQSGTWTRVL